MSFHQAPGGRQFIWLAVRDGGVSFTRPQLAMLLSKLG
ncbi:element, Orf2 protein, IS66 family [Escherichia coli DEC14A]|nr:element, Orf2 protein, IS66 family [Escherichia coli DEC14A]